MGFRPFVHRLANTHQLAGWVLNSIEGVEIEVEGAGPGIDAFIHDLVHKAPHLAVIHKTDVYHLPPVGYSSFIIETSHPNNGRTGASFPLMSPDIAACPECLAELFDAHDRRHRYPLINCTNCGPRFTIVEGVPYDRPWTTMKTFVMCPTCQSEYDDSANQRFHAQPNACRECGPSIWLSPSTSSQLSSNTGNPSEDAGAVRTRYPHPGPLPLRWARGAPPSPLRVPSGRGEGRVRVPPDSHSSRLTVGATDSCIETARKLLKEGRVLAVKGLGGFHLACDATSAGAVRLLRQRKRRVEKPFAIMVRDVEGVRKLCRLGHAEAQLLSSARRPIVLLERRPEGPVAPETAPNNRRLGVMLPYTPIHHLLLQPAGDIRFDALVMTSGHLGEELIAKDNDEALSRLAPLADVFLLHDRPIHVRCDDSVTQIVGGSESVIRRSRGYVPLPVWLDFAVAPILACGA